MKFPSIKTLADSAYATVRRFPFEVLFALTGTVAGTIEIELRNHSRVDEGWLMRIIMIANLGFLLSLSATLFTDSKGYPPTKKYVLKAITAVFAALLIFIINPPMRQADYTRFFLLSLAFHLLVAFAAFTAKGHIQGFWQFNKALFLRFLTAFLYGVVLFAGISAAIGAMNLLFNFVFEWDTYAILWVWLAGMFTTIFFLAGVPADLAALNDDVSYPKGLKVFTQYVLIPLSSIYVLILLTYEVKILLQWSLPKGLVSWLVLSYAVFGMLSLLLVHPIKEHNENKWIKTYARSFYFLLLPLLGLLFVGVGSRVFSYGITEFRYFLILLACWLLFISVYFLVFKKQNIKMIPASLCVATLLAIYGPQSAFSVSMYSQRRIIVHFFEKNKAFKNGKFMPVDSTKISEKDGSRAVANLEYFIENYDLTALQPYFNRDLDVVSDSLSKQKSSYNEPFLVNRRELRDDKFYWAKKQLGLTRFERYYSAYTDSIAKEKHYHAYTDENVTEVKGYDIMLTMSQNADTVINNYNGLMLRQWQLSDNTFFLRLGSDAFKFDIVGLVKQLLDDPKKIEKYREATDYGGVEKNYLLPKGLLSIGQETGKYKVIFQIDNIRFTKTGANSAEVNFVSGKYLVKIN